MALNVLSLKRAYEQTWFQTRLFLGLPAQTAFERTLIKTIFNCYKDAPLRIFEWGTGLSTLYYADFLFKNGFQFEWHAVENSGAWFQKMNDQIKSKKWRNRVRLYLREFDPFWNKPGWNWKSVSTEPFRPNSSSEAGYIQLPKESIDGKRFDVFMVDGRFRRRCLEVAQSLLSDDGMVILHDAQRKHYHTALSLYPFGMFFDGGAIYPGSRRHGLVWVGALKQRYLEEVRLRYQKRALA